MNIAQKQVAEAEARLHAIREDMRQSLESYYWPSDTNAGDKDAEAKFASARRSADLDLRAFEFAIREHELRLMVLRHATEAVTP